MHAVAFIKFTHMITQAIQHGLSNVAKLCTGAPVLGRFDDGYRSRSLSESERHGQMALATTEDYRAARRRLIQGYQGVRHFTSTVS